MKLEEMKKYMSSKIIVICTGAFILVALLGAAVHIFVMPFLVPSIPPGSMEWIEAGIYAFLVLIVGSFAIYWMSRLDLERKRAEEKIRYQASLVENVSDAIVSTDMNFNIVSWNKAAETIYGWQADEVIGKSVVEVTKAEYPHDRMEDVMGQVLKTGYWKGEVIHKRRDGTTLNILSSVSLLKDSSGNPVGTVGINRDITERKRAEEKIKQAAEEWRTTFDSIVDLVSLHDKDFRLTRVNKAFAGAFKMKPQEVIGKTCYEIVHGTNEPWPNCPHKATLETKKPAMAEFLEPHLGIHLEISTSPIFNKKGKVVGIVHIAKDITERKRMEEQLIVTDRLSSVGELAAGIAHELNNPLTSVIGFSQLLLGKDIPDDVREDVKIIYSEAQRTAEVVKNLLTFARRHALVKQPVNINGIIGKVLALRAYEQRVSNIKVNTRFAPDLPEIMADYFQLQQVFLNIVINAEHFMIEAHNRGTLTITTERTGDIIKASFADDGPGIPEENLGHLFDPFFTTKEVGRGTGLGLSICHGIITEHGGRIYAESELGKGATFIVELPISNLALIKKEG